MYVYMHTFMYVCMFDYVHARLSVWLSVRLSVCLSVRNMCVCVSVSLSRLSAARPTIELSSHLLPLRLLLRLLPLLPTGKTTSPRY